MSDPSDIEKEIAETLTELSLQMLDRMRDQERARKRAAGPGTARFGADQAQLATVAGSTAATVVTCTLVATAEQMLPGFADAFLARLRDMVGDVQTDEPPPAGGS